MIYQHIKVPTEGQKITIDRNLSLHVPDQPIIPFIEGDGTGPDIWKSSVAVFDAAVQKAYKGERKIEWFEVFAGEKVVEKNIMDIINNVKRSLKDNFQIDVKEAIISNPSRLNIETSENWQIYLNTDLESDLQIVKMNLLLRDEIPASGRKGLQYIDLRFKDRAYYK